MALWQVKFALLPKSLVADVEQVDAEFYSKYIDEVSERIAFILPDDYRISLAKFLLPATGWHEDMEAWGFKTSHRLEIWRENGAIESVELRVDARKLDDTRLNGLLELLRQWSYVLIEKRYRHVCQPDLKQLRGLVSGHPHSRALKDPMAWLPVLAHEVSRQEASPAESNAAEPTDVVMPLPRALRETIFTWVIVIIISSATSLAIHDLLVRENIIPAALWLGVVLLGLYGPIMKQGARSAFINLLGALFGAQFVAISSNREQFSEIRLGFRLFGKSFIQKTIPLTKVQSVEWDMGQASSMTGRVKNDWHLSIWYDRDDLSQGREWSIKPDQDVYCFGPSGKKSQIEALGINFINLLKKAGLVLVPVEESCFQRADPTDNSQ